MKNHTGMEAHDGYVPHSHEVRPDHLGVNRNKYNAQTGRKVRVIEIDPTELESGDVVLSISDHDESGCHCDVRVTVERRG